MNGTDRAVEAIMNYSKNGLDKELDVDYLNDNIQIYLMNEKSLYDGVYNTRRPAHSVAYDGLIKTINMDNNENLTSPQIKAGFKQLGLDFKEVIKPTVEFVEQKRKEAKEEDKKVKSTQDKYMVEITSTSSVDKKSKLTTYLDKMLDMKDAREPGKQPYISTPNKDQALKLDLETANEYIELLRKSYPEDTIRSIKVQEKEKHHIDEDKKEELFDAPEKVKQDSIDRGLYSENKKIESRTVFSTYTPTDDADDISFAWEDFENEIVPEISKQCRNDVLILAGTVGRWNGNFNGGAIIDVDDLGGFGDVDDIEITVDNGNVFWNGIHHDGTHIMQLFTIPEDEEARRKICIDLGVTDWLKEMYEYDSEEDCIEDALTYLDDVQSLNDLLGPEDYTKASEYFTPIKATGILTESKEEDDEEDYLCIDIEFAEKNSDKINEIADRYNCTVEYDDADAEYGPREPLNISINGTYKNVQQVENELKKEFGDEFQTRAEMFESKRITEDVDSEEDIQDQPNDEEKNPTLSDDNTISDKTILEYLEDRVGQQISVGEFNTVLQSIFGNYNKVYLQNGDLYNANLDEAQELVIWDSDVMYTIKYDIISLEDNLIEITDVDEEY